MRKTFQLSFMAVFAALHVTLYFVSFGLGWRNWGIYLEAIEGIVLGPKIGFVAALLGSSIARMARPDDFWMFGIIAEPISVLMAGFLAQGKWKPVVVSYAVMLVAYFVHPFGKNLPLWTILDVLLAFLLIYPTAKLGKNLMKREIKGLSLTMILIAFVTIATDSLVRIFLLVPCGLSAWFFPSFETLFAVFVVSAVSSYVEDLLVVFVSLVVGVPILKALSKLLKEKGKDAHCGNS
jgi:uncharacterized membrane protein